VTVETGVVTSKGQLVIPVRFRKRLGIKKGTTVAFSEEGGRLVIQPITAEFISQIRGSLKRKEK
jgi:AbrB family looped-hinge helix DNA binding protein